MKPNGTSGIGTQGQKIVKTRNKLSVNDDGESARQQRLAEIERVAREHGADLSEEGFSEVLKKVGKPRA